MAYFSILALAFVCCQVADAANWALLVAGSHGYSNYRHQADVCHAYQVLRQHGFPASNIIVMMRDDIANNRRNPYKGTIINKPKGPDVYKGVPKDYTGYHVLSKHFLNILQGNKDALKGIGSERVINSGVNDTIFVYYSDHGGRYHIAFPHHSLYEYQLTATIKAMHENKRYNKMVFYIEACYSGSMFYRSLSSNLNVFAVTASNERESSYAVYYDRKRRTYLGDEFSVNWLANSEKANWVNATIADQYSAVKHATKKSHVMRYGDSVMEGLLLNKFQGPTGINHTRTYSEEVPIEDRVLTWDVPYMLLMHDLEEAKTAEERLSILHEMKKETETRSTIRENIRKIAELFVPDVSSMMTIESEPSTVEQQKCYEQVSETFRKYVDPEKFDYALQDLHVFENLCIKGFFTESILDAVRKVCEA